MKLVDGFNRHIDYLRISITDHCNLNCLYCSPLGGRNRLAHSDILSYEEILRVVEAAVRVGISKVRITGGEPLLRRGVVKLCRMLSDTEALESLSVTTNGVLLQELAQPLFDAGVHRINVSLDTLRACAKISSQKLRSDLVQIWPIRLSKTTGIASYFADFANEVSAKDGLKLRCKNVKLFLRRP